MADLVAKQKCVSVLRSPVLFAAGVPLIERPSCLLLFALKYGEQKLHGESLSLSHAYTKIALTVKGPRQLSPKLLVGLTMCWIYHSTYRVDQKLAPFLHALILPNINRFSKNISLSESGENL